MANIIGVDVSKNNYDIFDVALNKSYTVSCQRANSWVNGLCKEAFVVFEATGIYSKRLAKLLSGAGILYAEVNPRHVRRYAQACGQLAKNDRIDAELIANYTKACNVQPKCHVNYNSLLRSLVLRREQLVNMITTEKGHLETCDEITLKKAIEKHIAALHEQRKLLEQQIKTEIQNDNRATIMKSMPCVGDIVASSLIAHMPELGTLKRSEAAALAGLAPYVRDSGAYKGRRAIYGGRPQVRRVLYMAAIVAIRRNPTYQNAYNSLVARGKPFKVAITAIMRKIIETLNIMCKNNQTWKQI